MRAPIFRRSLVGIALVSSLANAGETSADPWLASDKLAHFGVSTGIAVGTYATCAALLDARAQALLASAMVTSAIGVGKEALDLAGFGHASWKDLAWDGIGAFAGMALAWSVDLLVRGIGPRHPALGAPRAYAQPAVFAF